MFGRRPKVPFRTDPKAGFIAPVLDQDPKVFNRRTDSRPEAARQPAQTAAAPTGAGPAQAPASPPALSATQLSVLLHYFMGPDVAPFEPDGPEAHALFFLETEKLVEHLALIAGQPTKYAITERGRIYVDRVLAIPLPVAVTQWSFPDE